MKITNANNCKKWAKDLCDCNYLSQCELNKQQGTITLNGETFVHNPDSKQRVDIISPFNVNAIKVVSYRIEQLEKIIGGDSEYDERSHSRLDEANHILKLFQS